jgi:hypothetical protein
MVYFSIGSRCVHFPIMRSKVRLRSPAKEDGYCKRLISRKKGKPASDQPRPHILKKMLSKSSPIAEDSPEMNREYGRPAIETSTLFLPNVEESSIMPNNCEDDSIEFPLGES